MKKYYDDKKKGMIHSSKNEFANLPQEVKHVAYPTGHYGCDGKYVDSREGVDKRGKMTQKRLKSQMRGPYDAN